MPFDDYTLDPYSGGVTFRDSNTGEELLTRERPSGALCHVVKEIKLSRGEFKRLSVE